MTLIEMLHKRMELGEEIMQLDTEIERTGLAMAKRIVKLMGDDPRCIKELGPEICIFDTVDGDPVVLWGRENEAPSEHWFTEFWLPVRLFDPTTLEQAEAKKNKGKKGKGK